MIITADDVSVDISGGAEDNDNDDSDDADDDSNRNVTNKIKVLTNMRRYVPTKLYSLRKIVLGPQRLYYSHRESM